MRIGLDTPLGPKIEMLTFWCEDFFMKGAMIVLILGFLCVLPSHSDPVVIVTPCDCHCIAMAEQDALAEFDLESASALHIYYLENCLPNTANP